MKIGDFDRKITFEKPTVARVDGYTKPVYTDFHTDWGNVDFSNTGTDEDFPGQRKTAMVNATWIVRKNRLTSQVDTRFKLVDLSTQKKWDIRSIQEHREHGRNMYLILKCEQKGPENE